MTLEDFICYFDDMVELRVMEFEGDDDDGELLFKGCVFDDGAEETLSKLYDKGYVLDINDDGNAVLMFVVKNEHGVHLPIAQVNVKKPDDGCRIDDNKKEQRHTAVWLELYDSNKIKYAMCSRCSCVIGYESIKRYCPSCGARTCWDLEDL